MPGGAARAEPLPRHRMLDLLIIGAGAAGIAAGRTARGLGLRAVLLEARAVVGGRAITDNTTLGIPVDLGAHWLHSPASNPLAALAAGLRTRVLPGGYGQCRWAAGAWLEERERVACDDFIEHCFARIRDATRDHAVSELGFADRPFGRHFESEFRAKQGVATRDGSTVDFARYVWEGTDVPVLGGYGNLLGKLAAGLEVRLATPARRVDLTRGDRVRVHTDAGDLDARCVLVTVSTGVLQAGGLAFRPPLPDWKQAAIAGLPMGHCNKAAFRFTRRVLDVPGNRLLVAEFGEGESVEMVLRPGAD